jgi:hypothetical protein
MVFQTNTPLVGPPRRRGLRAILRFVPLADTPHAALVITRRGALVGVIPAGSRRTLSDYLDLPCELREVDMRERPLVLTRRCESAEQGFVFDVTLQIAYQVVRPEHVALAHVDVLAELEEAIDQRARAVAATLGVEQASVLKDYLVEALVTGNELPRRFEALGLALRRVDVAVELGATERTHAEAVRDQIRDRPLLARFRVETNQPDATFDVQVGGFYRVTSRSIDAESVPAEETIYDIVARALGRVGVGFAPEQYRDAARAMDERLWNDSVLKAELAAAQVELLRPAVHIFPDRALLEQLGRPLLLEDGRRREPRLRRLSVSPRLALAAPRDEADTPPASPLLHDAPLTVDSEVVENQLPSDPTPLDGNWFADWHASSAAPVDEVSYSIEETELLQPGALVPEAATVDEVEYTVADADQMAVEVLAGSEGSPATGIEPPVDAGIGAGETRPVDQALVERLVHLVQAGGPALFKLASLEIVASPAALPEIMRQYSAEPALLQAAEEPALQRAVAAVLSERLGAMPLDSRARNDVMPVQAADQVPDWMALRETVPGDEPAGYRQASTTSSEVLHDDR